MRTRWVHIHEFVLPPTFLIPPHGHEPPHVLVMLDGSLRERNGESAVQCDAGGIRYSPGADHHVVEVGPRGAHCLVVEARGFPELRLTRRVYFSEHDAGRLVAGVRQRLFADAEASPGAVEEGVLGLFSFVRNHARPSRVKHHRWIARVREALVALEVSPAPLADAARTVRRNPSVVARVFRATYGVSIHRFYRRCQIDRAWTLLGDGDLTLGAVAASAGFTDQSHLTRVFRSEIGVTPADARKGMRGAEGERNWFRAAPLAPINHDDRDAAPSRDPSMRTQYPTRRARSSETADRPDHARS